MEMLQTSQTRQELLKPEVVVMTDAISPCSRASPTKNTGL
jgi:hypothetical protein